MGHGWWWISVLALSLTAACGRKSDDDDDDDDGNNGGPLVLLDDNVEDVEDVLSYDYCYDYYDDYSYVVEPATTGFREQGTLSCETITGTTTTSGYTYTYEDFVDFGVDVWRFEASEGDTITVTVDTVSASTTFDPELIVVAPDTCVVAYADDAFVCSFPPPEYECPGTRFTAPESGAYHVVVIPLGECVGDLAGYEIAVAVD